MDITKALRQRIDEAHDHFDLEFHMSDVGQIYISRRLRRCSVALDNDKILLQRIDRRVYPAEMRWSLIVWPLQSDRRSATDHRAVLQVRPFIDDFRRRTDTLGPGAFDLAPVVTTAAPQMGYLSPNWPTASPLRHGYDVVAWAIGDGAVGLHGISRLIRASTIRYDTTLCVPIRSLD